MIFFILYFFLNSLSSDLKLYLSYIINYGSADEELGLYIEPETPPVGPHAFSVDPEGNLYIADPVNSSIKIFSGKKKKVLKIFSVKDFYDDLSVSPSGDIYLLKRASSEIIRMDRNGERGKFKIESNLTFKPCKLRLWRNKVFLEVEPQNFQILGKEKMEKGFYFYNVEYIGNNKGYIKKFDSDGNLVSRLSIERENLASLEFLNEDVEGNIYVQIEYTVSMDRVGLEVIKINQRGETIFVLQIPENDYFLWTSRLLYVNERGWVYQVLPKRDFVRVNIWK